MTGSKKSCFAAGATVALALPALAIAAGTSARDGAADDRSADTQQLQEVVVTGTPIRETVLETSFAVTVLDEKALRAAPPMGTAALLGSVPGLWAEGNGGEVNTNLSPRGLRGGFNTYISLQEDGLPVEYNGFLSEYEIRKDLTFDRVEVTRGGPSGVLTSNGAAAIANFISRMPTEAVEGEASVSYADFGSVRADVFYGGPIAGTNDWFGSIGGYYRQGDGIKDIGYQADHGGQVRAALMRKFEGGSVTVSYKHIDDHTTYFTPQPVQLLPNGKATAIPGFNATDDYLAGPETRLLGMKSPNGIQQTIDLADGQEGRTDQLTVRLELDLGHNLHLHDSARLASIHDVSRDLRGGSNSTIFPATSFLQSDPRVADLISQFAPQGAVGARLVRVDSGGFIDNPAAMNGNGLLVQQMENVYSQSTRQLINDIRLTHQNDRNAATLGVLSWDINQHVSQFANTFLLDVTNRAHLIDVAAVNAAGQAVGHLTDSGVLQYGTAGSYGNGTVETKSNSVYFNDDFRLTEQFHLDAGVRYEHVKYSGTAENQVSGAPLLGGFNPDGTPANNILADRYGGSFGTGTYTFGSEVLHDVAWTVGGNYKLTDNWAVYARYADAFDTGIANFGVFCAGDFVACLPSKTTKLKFYEVGVRYSGSNLYASATAFRSINKNIAILVGSAGDSVPVDNTANGVEFDAKWIPIDLLSFDLSGVIQKSRLQDVGVTGGRSFDGNQLDRLPNQQIRFTPTLHLLQNRALVYVTGQFYGKRFGDLANTLEFGSYTQLDAGVSVNVLKNSQVSLQGTNITDKFALTAGNPRGNTIVAGSNAYGFAHAILPRTVRLTFDTRF
jgi:iron complex outermembrane recepter protein